MNNVREDPNLPRQATDLEFVRSLQGVLREMLTAINQAAAQQIWRHVEVADTYSMSANDHVVIAKPSGAMTVTLPPAEQAIGKRFIVKRGNNTTHTVTIQPPAGNIDGSSSVTLTTAFQRREFFSDGVQYWEVT